MGTEEHPGSIPHQYDHLSADMIPDFKLMVKNIAEDINDLSKLTYMCSMNNSGTERTALDILRKLEQKGEFAHDNVLPLEGLVKRIDRCDLVSKHIESYKQKYGHYAVTPGARSSGRTTSLPVRSISKTSAHPSPSGVTACASLAPGEKLKRRAQTDPGAAQLQCTHDVNSQCPQYAPCNTVAEEESSAFNIPDYHGQFPPSQLSGMQHCAGAANLVPLRSQQKQERQQRAEEVNRCASRSQTPSTLCGEQYCHNNIQPRSGTCTPIGSTRRLSRPRPSNISMDTDLQEQLSLGSAASSMVSLSTMTSSSDHELWSDSMDEQEPQSFSELNDEAGGFNSLNVPSDATDYRMNRSWRSKQNRFLLNREKMAIMIARQKTCHYDKRFITIIPISKSNAGIKLTIEIFPYGRDADMVSHHATVLVQVSQYPSSGTGNKCLDMAENCACIVEVKTTFINSKTQERLSTREGKAELSSTYGEACVQINRALSHSDILYNTTDIQMQVEAVLRCRDKLVAAPCSDPDCSDYMVVAPNQL